MKRLFTLLLLSFAALSCEMIDEKLDDLLDKRDWVVFAEGTELTANVPSKQTVLNYKFESALDWEVKTDAEWLEIDPTSGKAGKDIKIQIKVAKNNDKEGRTGYADLTLSNDESYRITINQAGEGDENEDIVVDIPNNQIWYTSTDGEIVEPYSGVDNNYADALTTFGVNIVSNTYVDGKGVIEFDGDVTIIGDYAFLYCSNLTSVTIPDSVTTIGGGAFGGCENLEAVHITNLVSWCNIDFINPFTDGSVDLSANPLCYAKNLYLNGELVTDLVIPDGVNEIKLMAFALCESIKSVTIPDSVTTIGVCAFRNCSSLTNVTIGDSVTTIGDGAFYNCTSLTSVTIPDSVTTIGDGAFNNCTSLTSVTIGESVTTIGDYAFLYCSNLTSVTIPDSVTTIGGGAFGGCENLEAVHITNLVSWCNIDFINPFTDGSVDLSANPLCYAKNLYLNGELVTDLVIPDGVNEIKLMAFALCESIKSVTIPNSVTTIGEGAFISCSSLTSVTIGDSVTMIGDGAFRGCGSLTSVTIGNGVTTIGACAFYDCTSLTSVTIGDSVTTIGDAAFAGCSSLTSVTIPDSATTIVAHAFYNCSSLTSVYCKPTTPPAGGSYMFYDNAPSRKIYVPMESVEAYKSASYWSEYADDIVGYNF